MEERISGVKDTAEEMHSSVKENIRVNKGITQKHPGNLRHNEKTKPKSNRGGRRITAQRIRKYIQQNHRRKFPNLKKDMPIKIQEAYRTPNRLDPKKSSLIA